MKYTWTKRLSYATPIFAVIGILTAGGGHGTPVPMLIFYPILFVFKNLWEENLMWLIILGQFPAYGLLIDYAIWKSRQLIAIGLVILTHIFLVLMVINDQQFWDNWK